MTEKQKKHVDEDKAFILEQWEDLARAAWMGYQDSGRGLVFVDQRGAEGVLTPIIYIPASSPGLPRDYIVDLMRVYDPKTEIVVLVIHPDGTESGYRSGGGALPAPPDVYHDWKRHLQ